MHDNEIFVIFNKLDTYRSFLYDLECIVDRKALYLFKTMNLFGQRTHFNTLNYSMGEDFLLLVQNQKASLAPTSFPGSLLIDPKGRKDPGWSCSHGTRIKFHSLGGSVVGSVLRFFSTSRHVGIHWFPHMFAVCDL
jgi:hypothetical protein